jgi:hypothetical protein
MKKLLQTALLLLFTSTFAQKIFISEFHYDGPGADLYEFVEITGLTENKLDCYRLFYVNATAGLPTTYKEIKLIDSVIFAKNPGYGTLSLNNGLSSQIQNGSNDGFLLFDSCSNRVVQFISYEGSIAGMPPFTTESSVDVGVSETQGPDSESISMSGQFTALTWNIAVNSENVLNPNIVFPTTVFSSITGNVFINTNNCTDYDGPLASVTLTGPGDDNVLNTKDDDFFSVPTTPIGRFVLNNIPVGNYNIQVNPPTGYKVISPNPSTISVGTFVANYQSFCLEKIISSSNDDQQNQQLQVTQSDGWISINTTANIKSVVLSNTYGQTENYTGNQFYTHQKGLATLLITTENGVVRKKIILE